MWPFDLLSRKQTTTKVEQPIAQYQNECIMAASLSLLSRPSSVYKPALVRTREGWVAEYGDLRAAGTTPSKAMELFDVKWRTE